MYVVSPSEAALLVQQGIPQDKADRLVEALNAVLEHLPRTAQDTAFEQLIEELPKMIEKKPKEERAPGG
ncbi:MAG TPA: hypothetical protein VMX16_17330 [Terriglobia bacterium]|nr:hypothetical protein [Terriglobia bacterium]